MKKLLIILGVIVVVALAIGLIATQIKKEPKEIKIGATAFLTGKLANIGKSIQYGIELAVDEINKKGGISGKKIELILEDEGDNPQKAVSAIQKLINVDHVPIVIGPISSSAVMAVAPVANKSKIVIFSPGAASPNITYAGDFVFRNRAAGSLEAVEIAKFAFNKLELKNVIIFEINEDYGIGFRKVFKKVFEEMGGKVILIETYNQGDTDFRAQLLKFKGYKFDGIYVIGVANETGNILRQAKEMGIKTAFIMNNMENPELIRVAGDAAEGIFFPIPYFNSESFEDNVKYFVKKYKEKYGQTPDLFAANAYDAIYIAKYAIEKGGYNGEKIKKVLYSLKNFPVVSGGKISFDENGDIIQPLVIKTVKNGKFIIVEGEK